jgi:ribosome-binding factor A
MATIRQAKVGEMIKRELAEILQREMRDPRLALMSVTDVTVARDFTVAKVFVSIMGDEKEKAEGLKALQGAAGFLRGQLGHRIELRTVPQLMFRYDTGMERGVRMFELLRQHAPPASDEDKAGAENPVTMTEEDFARDDDGDDFDDAPEEQPGGGDAAGARADGSGGRHD